MMVVVLDDLFFELLVNYDLLGLILNDDLLERTRLFGPMCQLLIAVIRTMIFMRAWGTMCQLLAAVIWTMISMRA